MTPKPYPHPTFLQKAVRGFPKAAFAFFGVVLPLAALAIELTTNMCAETLNYNPIPTWMHIVAVALVPIVLGVWGALRFRGKTAASPAWRLALGVVAGISIVYAVPFLPVLPIAAIMALFGIGVLPFAPLASAVVALMAAWKSNVIAERRGWWGTVGAIGAIFALGLMAYPEYQTERAIEKATSVDVAERHEGIGTLRSIDTEIVHEFACNYRRDRWPNPIDPLAATLDQGYYDHGFHPELYWKVTGEQCKEQRWSRNTRFLRGSQKQDGLKISTSRIDSSVNASAGTAYTEWLYEVKNSSSWNKEADFILQLPAGGAVSRVTLWVHDEPKEATFAGRGKAEEAYQSVVNRNRDPILVSSAGPNRVRVRMFPVPGNGTMKARIGVTHPLRQEQTAGAIQFPYISSANLDYNTKHSVWIESNDELSISRGGESLKSMDVHGIYEVRGMLDNEGLKNTELMTTAAADFQIVKTDYAQVKQTVLRQNIPRVEGIVLIIDGSKAMEAYVDQLAAAVDKINVENVSLIFTGDDEPVVRFDRMRLNKENRRALYDAIRTYGYAGGRDAVPALQHAQQIAVRHHDRVVWVHTPQHVGFGGFLAVEGRDDVVFDELQVSPGRDINVDQMYAAGRLNGVPRYATPGEDLGRFFEQLSGNRIVVVREIAETFPLASENATAHIARLFAHDEAIKRLRAGDRERAIEIAGRARVVTPVSSAIVLETEEQYREFGLEQANGTGVPTIPEPEEWALIIIATFALLSLAWKRRREEDALMPAL